MKGVYLLETVLILLIIAVLNGALIFLDTMLVSLIPIGLHAEDYMGTLTGSAWFGTVCDVFFSVGISLIVLKFLYKGFNTYVAWTEGDPDADPMGLVTNFIRAMAVAISFPIIFDWMCDTITELTDRALEAIGAAMHVGFAAFISGLASSGLFTALVSLVFFIMFFVLYIQFLGRGMELLILRIGVPFACTGLLDSDKGVFGAFAKKFLQSVLTVMIQIVAVKLGVALMLNNQILWGIAAMLVALRTPKLLQEFILPYGASGMMNTVYHASRLSQMVRRAVSVGRSASGLGGAGGGVGGGGTG